MACLVIKSNVGAVKREFNGVTPQEVVKKSAKVGFARSELMSITPNSLEMLFHSKKNGRENYIFHIEGTTEEIEEFVALWSLDASITWTPRSADLLIAKLGTRIRQKAGEDEFYIVNIEKPVRVCRIKDGMCLDFDSHQQLRAHFKKCA